MAVYSEIQLEVCPHLQVPPVSTMSDQVAAGKVTSQAAQKSVYVVCLIITFSDKYWHRGVLMKLIIFSFCLAVVPITSYFVTEKYVWNGMSGRCMLCSWLLSSPVGNSNYAAITAIFAANAVLFAYIITSLWEDRTSMQMAEQKKLQPSESRKTQ